MRLLLPLAYLIIAAGMLFVVRHVRAGRATTLSLHAAAKPLTYWIFALSLTLGICLLAVYAFSWLIPHYKLGTSFFYVFMSGVVSVLAVAWIPDARKWHRAHIFAAYCVLASQAIIVGTLLISAHLSIIAWIISWLMLMAMLLLGYILFFKTRARQLILFLESALFMTFPAALLAVSYL